MQSSAQHWSALHVAVQQIRILHAGYTGITQPRGARYVTMLRIEILHAMCTGSAQPRSAQHVTARQIEILQANYTDSAHPSSAQNSARPLSWAEAGDASRVVVDAER